MICAICGRELIRYDWLITGKGKVPVCHDGYDCYKPEVIKPISPKMAKVNKHAKRFAS